MDVQAHNPSHPTGLYAALPSPTWFRVLELLPGHGEEALALRLHAVDGAEPPYYEAVSYAWGDPNDVVPVECNGQRLFVTTSLHVALLHFRDRNEPRMLWADAVCINQADPEERGGQVVNMHTIYAKASRTLLWLGPDPLGQGATALGVVDRIASSFCRERGRAGPPKRSDISWLLGENERWFQSRRHARGLSEAAWRSLEWFYGRPWFCRLWVIQEVMCSGQPVFVCGAAQGDVVAVTLAAIILCTCSQLREGVVTVATPAYRMLTSFTKDYFIHGADFLFSMRQGRLFRTTDPRDRVYGMLNLPAFGPLRGAVPPDYSRTLDEISLRVATAAIEQDGLRRILEFVYHRGGGLNRPSWVPRWDVQYDMVCKFPPRLRASGDYRGGAGPAVDGTRLVVPGLVYDVVVESVCPLPASDGRGLCNLLDPGLGLARKTRHCGTTEKALLAFELLLRLCGRDTYADADAAKLRLWYLRYAWTSLPGLRSSIPLSEEHQVPLTPPDMDTIRRCHATASYVCFFVTSRGLFGVGPPLVNGDQVCILAGARVPYILRREGDHHLLVGNAYVHEIMNGEAVLAFERNLEPDITEQVFTIH